MNLTSFDVATRLKLFTKKGEPHRQLVREIIRDIGSIPFEKRNQTLYYPEGAVQLVRQWFYLQIGIDFSEFVTVGNREFFVYYDEESALAADKQIVA